MELLRDIKSGIFLLRKTPGVTATIVLILGISIGAITAIYSLLDAIIFRPLPVQNPERLVLLKWNARHFPKTRVYIPWFFCADNSQRALNGITGCSFSMPLYQQLHAQQDVFDGIFAFAGSGKIVANINNHAHIAQGEYVSGDFFTTLGLHATSGRELSRLDDAPEATPVVVLSYQYWTREFGQDASLVGKAINLNGVSTTIIGIMPRDFQGLDPGISADLWLPFSLHPTVSRDAFATINSGANFWWVSMIARLKKETSIKQAETAIDTAFLSSLAGNQSPLFKFADKPQIKILSAAHGLASLNHDFSRSLLFLLIAAGALLLISSANVAGLVLSRAASRKREVAVRLALGATRWRISRQIFLENLLLSTTSGIFGVFIAWWGASLLTRFLASNLQEKLQIDVHPNMHILAFTAFTTVVIGVLFGVPSAIHSSKIRISNELKERTAGVGGSTHSGRRRFTLGNGLVVVQVALATAALITAGLLIHTLAELKTVSIGFNENNVLLFGVDPTQSGYQRQQTQILYRELQNRVSEIPGVTSVSYSDDTLFSGNSFAVTAYFEAQAKQSCDVYVMHVAPKFFGTMKVPLESGRDFEEHDLERTTPATQYIPAIVNERFAQQFEGENPLGKRISLIDKGTPTIEIVGIVADMKYGSVRAQVTPMVYLPFEPGRGFFEVRSSMDPMTLVPAIRRVVAEAASTVPVFGIKTQSQEIAQTIYQERLLASISGIFAIVGAVLACVGLYGLLSFQVLQRTQEIGVRLAFGAYKRHILKLIVLHGLALAGLGELVGIAITYGTIQYVKSILYNVQPHDPVAILSTLTLLILIAILASYLPAVRAMRVDPATALRCE